MGTNRDLVLKGYDSLEYKVFGLCPSSGVAERVCKWMCVSHWLGGEEHPLCWVCYVVLSQLNDNEKAHRREGMPVSFEEVLK
jgi:hypothetical protein